MGSTLLKTDGKSNVSTSSPEYIVVDGTKPKREVIEHERQEVDVLLATNVACKAVLEALDNTPKQSIRILKIRLGFRPEE